MPTIRRSSSRILFFIGVSSLPQKCEATKYTLTNFRDGAISARFFAKRCARSQNHRQACKTSCSRTLQASPAAQKHPLTSAALLWCNVQGAIAEAFVPKCRVCMAIEPKK
jgi:hypothetical protein